MAGYTRPLPVPMIQQARTTDPYTGAELTKKRPFTPLELMQGAGKVAGMPVPGALLRGRPLGTPMPGASAGDGGTMEDPSMSGGGSGSGMDPYAMMRRQRRPGMPVPGVMATYAPDDGRRIDAHTYGDTVARQSGGFEGLDAGFYGKNKGAYETFLKKSRPGMPTPAASMAGLQGDTVRPGMPQPGVQFAAYGTMKSRPVPLGKPLIVGDPQADGKPNPELVVPTAQGVHVIPLKDLPGGKNPYELMKRLRRKGMPVPLSGVPKLAYGTVDDLGLSVLPVENRRTGDIVNASRVAFDAQGRMVGAGTGVTPTVSGATVNFDILPPASPPAMGAMRPGMPRPAAAVAPTDFAALEQQRRVAENPDGIVVGVTPREALASPMRGMPAMSREQAQMQRLQRQIGRAAQSDPRLAMAVVDRKEAAEQAGANARGRALLEAQKEMGRMQRMRIQMDATGARQRETQEFQAKQAREKAVATQRAADDRFSKTLDGQRQRLESMIVDGALEDDSVNVLRRINDPAALKSELDYYRFNQKKPSATEVKNLPVPNSNLVVPTIGGNQISGAPVLEQSTVTAHIPGTPSWMSLAPQVPPTNVTGPGPLMKPQKATATRLVKPTNFGNDGKPDWREQDPETGVWRKVRFEEAVQAASTGAASKETADAAMARLLGKKG